MSVNTKSTISSAKLGCDKITNIDEINPYPDTDSLDTERKGFSSKNDLEDDKNVSPERSCQHAQTLCYKDVAEETRDETKRSSNQSCNQSQADVATNLITTDGGVIQLTDVILRIDAGCLAEDTEITSRIDDENDDLKSLFDLDLIQGASNVVKFLPNDLTFLKPADLKFKHESPASGNDLFILRGSFCDNRKTVWKLVSSDMIQEYTEKGVVNVKIEGFSLYCYILARRGKLARIFSHFNKSFTCFAYALYRRQLQLSDEIDIIVVFVSEFVEKDTEIKQLNDLYEDGYVKSDKGAGKRLQINSHLQMCLNFLEYKDGPLLFHIDQPQLDSIGYVLDRFKGVPIKFPARGTVTISEVFSEENSTAVSELPWVLNIVEQEQKVPPGPEPPGQLSEPEPEPEVILRDTKLTGVEITRVSHMVAMDWDSLAGLMDISYEKREEIRINFAKYPDSPSKAEEVLKHFNGSNCFGRDVFGKCADELGRHDLIKKLHPMENKKKRTGIVRWKKRIPSSQIKEADNEEIKKLITRLENSPEENVQPLSPREMFRLSRCVGVDWDSLAGLMDIAKEERDDIRYNVAIYSDHRSRAEKILSIFNHKKEFSRKKLVEGLKEIKKLDVIRPIITGKWKNL